MKAEPNKVKWVVKFVQKWNLTLLYIIRHEGVVVNYVKSLRSHFGWFCLGRGLREHSKKKFSVYLKDLKCLSIIFTNHRLLIKYMAKMLPKLVLNFQYYTVDMQHICRRA